MKKDKNIGYDENRIYNNFENINNWISNCDNKASIMLGFIGIIATILLTNNKFINILIKLLNEIVKKIDFSGELYIILLFSTILFVLYGIFNIFKVICPILKNTNSENKSLIYYDSISKMDLTDYKKAIFNSNEKDYLEDLLNQLHINARICSKKFLYFKKGLTFTLYGLIGFLIVFITGIIAYL